MSTRLLVCFFLLLTASPSRADEQSKEGPAKRFELGFSFGRMESVGVAHELYDSHPFVELMFSWNPGLAKALRLQARIAVNIEIDSFTNRVLYFSDSSSQTLNEKVTTGITVASLGLDYSIAVSTKPPMELRLGFGYARTKLQYNSLIDDPPVDTSFHLSEGRKSYGLSRTASNYYLRSGLEVSLGSRIAVIAEITRLDLPDVYQDGGIALGQYGDKHDMLYYVFGLNWIIRI